jgi:hypothetical protein
MHRDSKRPNVAERPFLNHQTITHTEQIVHEPIHEAQIIHQTPVLAMGPTDTIISKVNNIDRKMDVSSENTIAMQGLLQDLTRRSDKTNCRVRNIELTLLPQVLTAISNVSNQISSLTGMAGGLDAIYQNIYGMYDYLEQQVYLADDSPFVVRRLGYLADYNVPGSLTNQIETSITALESSGLSSLGFTTPLENAIYQVLVDINTVTGFPVGFSYNMQVISTNDVKSMVPLIESLLLGNYTGNPVFTSTQGVPIYLPTLALNVKGLIANDFIASFPQIVGV